MPINRAKAMLDTFASRGRVTRPWLGIAAVYVTGDLAEMLELPAEGGLLIQTVERGSAAAEAGLRGYRQVVIVGGYQRLGVGGDLIVAIDGTRPQSNDSLRRALDRKRAGDVLELTIYRAGQARKVRVTLGEAPQAL